MENIYANVDYNKLVFVVPTTDHRGSSSSQRRICLGVNLFLVLLSVCLLVGLIVLGVHFADLFNINEGLTKDLQASNDNISTLMEERKQLKANLTKMNDRTCPAGWIRFKCSCYLLSPKSDTWDKGREDCRGRGADLVVIDSSEEQNFLFEIAKGYTWIGLDDKETEGTFKWVDGTNLTLMNWAKSQPDNAGEEDCVHLRGHDGKDWNDIKCTISFVWICEKETTCSTC